MAIREGLELSTKGRNANGSERVLKILTKKTAFTGSLSRS
jgi:hypothetical protein